MQHLKGNDEHSNCDLASNFRKFFFPLNRKFDEAHKLNDVKVASNEFSSLVFDLGLNVLTHWSRCKVIS